MFNSFFYELKRAQVPVSLREYLTLLEAVEALVITRLGLPPRSAW